MSHRTILITGGVIFLGILLWGHFHTQKPVLPDPYQIAAQTIQTACAKESIKEHCYAKQFGELTKRHDMEFAKQTLLTLQKTDNQARGCHFISHAIAYAETLKDVSRWKELLAQQNPGMCSGGFLHGIIEIYTGAHPNITVDAPFISEVCSVVKQRGGEFDCSHIMGHLLLVENDVDIAKSVTTCSQISKDFSQFECYSGVFMEYLTRENLVAHRVASYVPWNENFIAEMEQICSIYSGVASQGCWREISHVYAFVYKNDPDQVLTACHRAPDEETARFCYRHAVGIMTVSSGFNQDKFDRVCSVFTDETLFNECVSQLVSSMMVSSHEFFEPLRSYCDRIPEQSRFNCYERLFSYIQNQKERQMYCKKIDTRFHNACWLTSR